MNTFTLDFDAIAELSTELVDNPAPPSLFGAGDDFWIVTLGSGWLLRLPRRPIAVERLRREQAFLPILIKRMPTPIPRPVAVGTTHKGAPHGYMLYRLVPGVPAAERPDASLSTDCAAQLGESLAALHNTPLAPLLAAGVQRAPLPIDLSAARGRAFQRADALQERLPTAVWNRYCSFLSAPPTIPAPYAGPAAPVHDDLSTEHILLDPDTLRIAGIIDWADLIIGDPAFDFWGVYHWQGRHFVKAMLAAYAAPQTHDMLDRIQHIAVLMVIPHLQNAQGAEVDEWVTVLRRCLD